MKSVLSYQEELDAAKAIWLERYPDASALFLAGSIVRGEGTKYSDLDIVVVYERLSAAYRESYMFGRWPVEAFIHDLSTLAYFFKEIDRKTGVPSLATMISEGVEIPESSGFSALCKNLANTQISKGPPKWHKYEIDASRYSITNLVDDIRQPRSYMEVVASGSALHSALAIHVFRTRGMWSAGGKMIPRQLENTLPDIATDWRISFTRLFETGCSDSLVSMVEMLLEPDGGFLFEGYSQTAPANWRFDGDA